MKKSRMITAGVIATAIVLSPMTANATETKANAVQAQDHLGDSPQVLNVANSTTISFEEREALLATLLEGAAVPNDELEEWAQSVYDSESAETRISVPTIAAILACVGGIAYGGYLYHRDGDPVDFVASTVINCLALGAMAWTIRRPLKALIIRYRYRIARAIKRVYNATKTRWVRDLGWALRKYKRRRSAGNESYAQASSIENVQPISSRVNWGPAALSW